ncbi:Adenosine kinase [Halotydeus destructor]|nr:Adenosine kinase [Halotydeus destructor]
MAELREGLLFGIGNPLLDISADVDEDFLKKYQLEPNLPCLADPAKHDGLFEDMVAKYGDSINYTAGGASQNAMRATQWMLGKPNVCTFTGCVGDDAFGEILTKKARDDGVNVMYMISNEEKTGTCACCITKGGANRSLVAYLGASSNFKKSHLLEIWNYVEQAQFYYASGFHLIVSPESVLALGEHSEKNPEKRLCFNFSADYISKFYSEALLSVLPYVDIVFGNETEAVAFAQLKGWPETLSVREIAIEICKLDKVNKSKERIVVITQGADEIFLVQNNGATVQSYPANKLEASKVVDTNGAGDAFVGGFLSQLLQGKKYDTCISAGIYAATEVIQQSGVTMPGENKFKA